jgi:hypothetical protein
MVRSDPLNKGAEQSEKGLPRLIVAAAEELVLGLLGEKVICRRVGEEDAAFAVEEKDGARGGFQSSAQKIGLDQQTTELEGSFERVRQHRDQICRRSYRLPKAERGVEFNSSLEGQGDGLSLT